ncbi:hypothetical protein Mapa_007632 [Marchantia paleacea]|nr:hypothetical protein Mapa_007632 [Marchantia paleacea]
MKSGQSSSGSKEARRPSVDADSQKSMHMGRAALSSTCEWPTPQGRRCYHSRTTHSALMQRPTRHHSRCSCSCSH